MRPDSSAKSSITMIYTIMITIHDNVRVLRSWKRLELHGCVQASKLHDLWSLMLSNYSPFRKKKWRTQRSTCFNTRIIACNCSVQLGEHLKITWLAISFRTARITVAIWTVFPLTTSRTSMASSDGITGRVTEQRSKSSEYCFNPSIISSNSPSVHEYFILTHLMKFASFYCLQTLFSWAFNWSRDVIHAICFRVSYRTVRNVIHITVLIRWYS